MTAQAEMKPEIALGKIAPAASDFVGLREFAAGHLYPRIQGQLVAPGPHEFETDPVIARSASGTQDCRFPFQVFHDNLLNAVVKQVRQRKAPPYSRSFQRRTCLVAYIAECSVAPIQKELARFTEINSDVCVIHLRVYMTIHRNQVQPSIVIDVIESITPAHVVGRGSRYSRDIRDISKTQAAIIAEKLQILLAEMSERNGETAGMQIISERDPHIRQRLSVLIESYAPLVTNFPEVPVAVIA